MQRIGIAKNTLQHCYTNPFKDDSAHNSILLLLLLLLYQMYEQNFLYIVITILKKILFRLSAAYDVSRFLDLHQLKFRNKRKETIYIWTYALIINQ